MLRAAQTYPTTTARTCAEPRADARDVPRAPDRNNSGVVDGDAYVADIGAVLRLEIDMT